MCLLLTAPNVALTASSFGITLAMMNTRVKRLFSIDMLSHDSKLDQRILPRKVRDFELDTDELCAAYRGTVVTSYAANATGSLIVRNCTSKWRPVAPAVTWSLCTDTAVSRGVAYVPDGSERI